jgi:chromosome segregation ATPase
MGRDKSDSNVNVTEILNIQILQDTIRTLEETKLKLLQTVKELKEQLQQQKDDQADIYFYLNKKCDESFEVIASLEEQLSNEQSDREVSEKLYEAKLEEARTSYANMETKLNAKIGELESRLEMMNKYGESKDEMDRNLTDLMNKLEEERKQFRITAESMENKFLMEREKMRKTYETKYENLKKDVEASIDGKITKKTQRTQIMNAVIRKELDTQVMNEIINQGLTLTLFFSLLLSPLPPLPSVQTRRSSPGDQRRYRGARKTPPHRSRSG